MKKFDIFRDPDEVVLAHPEAGTGSPPETISINFDDFKRYLIQFLTDPFSLSDVNKVNDKAD